MKLGMSPMPMAHLADLLAFNFLDDVCLKQSLLAETNVRQRVERVINALENSRPRMEAKLKRRLKDVGSAN